jgi:hypothetical protein
VTALASPTNDATPTWTWVSGGGGSGNYRYKLNDSSLSTDATAIAATSLTPGSNLSDGVHTLYLQERDAAGNWSAMGSASVTIDATPPNAPNVSGPASPNLDRTPTWTWVSGGEGNGTFRYNLDLADSTMANGAVETTVLTFMPAADLSIATHVLYVWERDTLGNWSNRDSASVQVVSNLITTVDAGGSVGSYTSISVPSDGLPVISYYYITNQDLKVVKCGKADCSTGNIITTLDAAGMVGSYSSITVAQNGLPIISYYDETNGNMKVVKCGKADCSSGNTLTTVDAVGNVGQYTSITVPSDGLPVISYYDITNQDLKVVKCGMADCSSGNTITTVDAAGSVGLYASIAVPSGGFPVIGYYGANNLKVVECGTTDCSSGNTLTTVDAAGMVGLHTAITVPSDGIPIISYYDATNNDLKVAKCGKADCSP